VDASGKWVTPGIVAGFSRLGLTDVSGGAQGANDENAEKGPFNAAIDIAPAINPNYQPVKVNRADGVTRAVVAPRAAHNIFAGQGAVIDTGADMDPITKARAFQFVELGETGAENAGGSRPSAYVLFRNALREAGELTRFAGPLSSSGPNPPDARLRPIQNPNESRVYSRSADRSQDVLLTRFDAAALVPVLQGRQPLLVHVERASDILNVLDLAREFPRMKFVIVGASEGWLVADQLARSGIPVIASALNDLPASFEQIAATQSNIGRMRAAGVKVSIGMIDDDESHRDFYERQYAGNLVALQKVPGAAGVSWGEALAMITSLPADAVGLGGQIGRLSPGEHADVVIWSGDPLEVTSGAEQVFIDGVQQPLDDHQSRLLERYRDLTRRALPPAYRP
jgi:imidazolonepropionase-like amidohydrolase